METVTPPIKHIQVPSKVATGSSERIVCCLVSIMTKPAIARQCDGREDKSVEELW